MPESSLSSAINKHYLSRVMDLAEVMDVEATEDVIDAHGMKLVAKGAKVSRSLQEKLLVHKLKKPLESSMIVAGGVNPGAVIAMAKRILETSAPMARILRASGGSGASPLALLSTMEFGNAMGMMLTITERNGAKSLEHSVLVSLLSICMAKKLRLTEQDQKVAGLAGLLHDVGELYIDPAYLVSNKRLQPHEWSHLVVHPTLGQILIDELESYPRSVGRAVAEHHERFDGTGYPRHTAGNHISGPGQAVSAAEVIAGVLGRDHPLERAELAFKIIPGEHPHDLVSAISGALRTQSAEAAPEQSAAQPPRNDREGVERLFRRIEAALASCQDLLNGSAAKSPKSVDVITQTLYRIKKIQRGFVSTGLDAYLGQNKGLIEGADQILMFEKAVSTLEIQWRLRDIARDLALNMVSPDEKTVFAPLIDLLDDDSAGELGVASAPDKIEHLTPASFEPGRQRTA